MKKLFDNMEKTALISSCGRYRSCLGRHWNREAGYVLFIGLNPSTADAEQDDPTIRRCIKFATDWGYGGIEMCNLFDWRSTDPKLVPRDVIAVSEENDPCLSVRVNESAIVVAAWGAIPWAAARINEIRKMMFVESKRWHCLGKTKEGFPRHPLYVPAKQQPELFW